MWSQAQQEHFKPLKQPLQNGTTSLVFQHSQVRFLPGGLRSCDTIMYAALSDYTCNVVGVQGTDLNQALLSSVLQAAS